MAERIVRGISTVEQRQHVEMYRKLLLRRRMLRWAQPGAYYVPFIGDGDIARAVYSRQLIFGADLDPSRVATAQDNLPGAQIIVADCTSWVFAGYTTPDFAVADFDAYVDPYTSFRSFWHHAPKTDRVVLFFTDGRKQGMGRTGHWTKPDGSKVYLKPRTHEKAQAFNFYLAKHVFPWFTDFVAPWRVLELFRYQRSWMIYWGAAVERPAT